LTLAHGSAILITDEESHMAKFVLTKASEEGIRSKQVIAGEWIDRHPHVRGNDETTNIVAEISRAAVVEFLLNQDGLTSYDEAVGEYNTD
jgi:hypothetical protein